MDFSGYNDRELFEFMAMQTSEPACARSAWDEFYRRHAEYLLGVTLRAYGRQLGGEEGAADLVQESFQKAWRWAGTHEGVPSNFDRFKGKDSDEVRRRVRLWLGRVAENSFKDILREEARKPEGALPDDVGDERESRGELPSPEIVSKLNAALDTLAPRDREILLACLPWYDPSSSTFVFGPGEAEALATSLGTTVDALRQRRHRALISLKRMMTNPPVEFSREGGRT